jgi:hypothetical protein
MPSNLKFGLFFTFVLISTFTYLYVSEGSPNFWILGLSGVFALLSLLKPEYLEPLNKVWYLLGLSLGKIVSPLVLGTIFFLIITPVALVLKIKKRDVLFIKKRHVQTYWIDRTPHGPDPESFKNQF